MEKAILVGVELLTSKYDIKYSSVLERCEKQRKVK